MRALFLCFLAISLLFASCAGFPQTEIPSEPVSGIPVEIPPDVPPVPVSILGQGLLSSEHLAAFLIESNPSLSTVRASELALLYIEEARIEGVNSDIAFSQMCLETGYLRFGGLVTPDMNNFCGLGAIGNRSSARLPIPGTNGSNTAPLQPFMILRAVGPQTKNMEIKFTVFWRGFTSIV